MGEDEGAALGAAQRPQRALQFALTSRLFVHLLKVFFLAAHEQDLDLLMFAIKNLTVESSHSAIVDSS